MGKISEYDKNIENNETIKKDEFTSNMLKSLNKVPLEPIPESFKAKLSEAIKIESQNIVLLKHSARKKRFYRWIGTLAAVFMVGFISITMYNNDGTSMPDIQGRNINSPMMISSDEIKAPDEEYYLELIDETMGQTLYDLLSCKKDEALGGYIFELKKGTEIITLHGVDSKIITISTVTIGEDTIETGD